MSKFEKIKKKICVAFSRNIYYDLGEKIPGLIHSLSYLQNQSMGIFEASI